MKMNFGIQMVILLLLLSFQAMAVGPNFVVIMADDLGYGDLGCTGSRQIPTPHIDSLARDGVFCSRAYVTAPMCAPSRMGMLTGRFPKRFGITTNPNVKMNYLADSHYGLPKSEKCFPKYLRPLGYACAVIGKWHLGHAEGQTPVDRGFDTWWGFLGGSRHYFPQKKEVGGLNPSAIVSNVSGDTQVRYLTDDLARESIRFIEKHKNRDNPFFLFVSFNAPHTPYEAKREDLEVVRGISDPVRRKYAAVVHGMDKAVGRILKALDEAGKSRDTMVVFLSDNGGAPDGPACNAPFKGEKRLHYEGGVRVPMIIRFPDDERVRPGFVCGQVISTVDFLPTLLKLNGVAIPEGLDGQDMMPMLKSADSKISRTLYWCTDYTSAILHGNLKYLLVPNRLPELYDIDQDRTEMKNLFPACLRNAAPLADKLGSYLMTTPPCRYPDAVSWSASLMKQYDKAKPGRQPE